VNTETITLEIRKFPPAPPEHGRGPCLCNGCWHEYLAWCDREHDRAGQ
jgi:hypothetical protein